LETSCFGTLHHRRIVPFRIGHFHESKTLISKRRTSLSNADFFNIRVFGTSDRSESESMTIDGLALILEEGTAFEAAILSFCNVSVSQSITLCGA
jgi:hypothetical protein